MSHSGGSLYKDGSGEKREGRKWTTIIVSVDVRRELEALRRELGARSFNEVIRRLIDERREAASRRIKAVMCNDFKDTVASYVAWVKLLAARGFRAGEIAEALKYLTGTINELVVNAEKCKEE